MRQLHEGENAIMTSQFMAGVAAGHTNGQHGDHQHLQQPDQNLMSGGRVSIGNNATYNPFLYSAGIDSIMGPGKTAGPAGVGEVSQVRNFLNTPGQMLN